ncbi:MAG: NfeD family protein [Clostridia bacterium]
MEGIMEVLTNLPAMLCLVIGLVLVIVEMFLPGFGVPGITGIVLLIAGTVIGASTVAQGLVILGVALILLLIALPFGLRSLAKGRLDKTKVVLNTVSFVGGEHNMDAYLGKEGVARTTLRPSGIVEFDGDRVNVVSDGAFIAEGGKVRVQRVDGNRVVVKEIDQA